ncbi:MAG: V-type ATP synthase subunit I [Clostridia bacterium]|nr:V-type ATP synthase subunit I [Clostridia bacterium]
MAIVEMSRITLIGLNRDKEMIMDALMKLGAIELADADEKLASEEWSSVTARDGDAEEVSSLENKLEKLRFSIEYLAKFDKRKKGLFENKRNLKERDLDAILADSPRLWSVVDSIISHDESLTALKNARNKKMGLIASLKPWESLDVPLQTTSTDSTVISIGVTPAASDAMSLLDELLEHAGECHAEIINQDKEQTYLLIIYHKASEQSVSEILKKFGFSRVTFKGLEGTPAENIKSAEKEIQDIDNQCFKIEGEVSSLVNEKASLEVLFDYTCIQRDKKKALHNILKTESAFFMEGWVPSASAGKVTKHITDMADCIVEIRKPDKDEEYPILLSNPSVVQPFEMITEMYSLPSSKGIDPNIFMAPFYFVFFGLMVSDAGYGILMACVTGILLLKFKFEGMLLKLMRLLFLGGISTFIWGVLFGGWFGNIADIFAGRQEAIPPLWFNPLNDPMRLLIWSMIFGAVHLFTGMALKAYMLVRDGKPLDALFDIGFWYIFLIGLPLMGFGGMAAVVGKYMALAGAILLVLTQGRNEKGIVRKLLSGVLSLYNVTGYLSDVLSYSRLLALGLATGVIATVINTVGTLFGFNVLGIIVLAAVFIGGHIFNILINALGAYVHASRLQYVEFFSKFYEGGGQSFRPFKRNTKYINLLND